jgi:hypothetical protein
MQTAQQGLDKLRETLNQISWETEGTGRNVDMSSAVFSCAKFSQADPLDIERLVWEYVRNRVPKTEKRAFLLSAKGAITKGYRQRIHSESSHVTEKKPSIDSFPVDEIPFPDDSTVEDPTGTVDPLPFEKKEVARYLYYDENKSLVYAKVRYEPKSFLIEGKAPEQDLIPYKLPELIEASKNHQQICICEGEKDVETLISLGFSATTMGGSSTKIPERYLQYFNQAEVILFGDNDKAGQLAVHSYQNQLEKLVHLIRGPIYFGIIGGEKCDVTDWLLKGRTGNELSLRIKRAPVIANIVDLIPTQAEFLVANIEPRTMLIDPLILEKSLNMIYAFRGVGKSRFVISLAFALATGTNFLKFTIPNPRKVLFIDGEMDIELWRKWEINIIKTFEKQLHIKIPIVLINNCVLVARDYFAEFYPGIKIPNLASEEGRYLIDKLIEKYRPALIIFDNRSSLFQLDSTNGQENVDLLNELLLHIKDQGSAVIIVHHSGKGENKDQRGSSKAEDWLSTSLKLEEIKGEEYPEGCKFRLNFTKYRANINSANFSDIVFYSDNEGWTYSGGWGENFISQKNPEKGLCKELVEYFLKGEIEWPDYRIAKQFGNIRNETIKQRRKEWLKLKDIQLNLIKEEE